MTPAQEALLNRALESLGTLREHEKAHYDAINGRVGALATDLAALSREVRGTDPDSDLSRRGSLARQGVRDVVGLALREDFQLDERLARIEQALGIQPADPRDGEDPGDPLPAG